MSAHEVTKALGGSWHGRYGIAKCPCHDDKVPSLQVSNGNNGELVVHCHAGCTWQDVKAALRSQGVLPEWAPDRTSARTLLINGKPISFGGNGTGGAIASSRTPEPDNGNTAHALELWRGAQPAGVIARAYLTGRGIAIDPPASIRELASLRHAPSGLDLPCLICAVQAPDRRVVAITRIFLSPDCTQKATVMNSKMSLGPLTGNAVRLARAGPTLAICEGVETGLSIQERYGLPTWCALGASNLPNVVLPPEVTRVIVCADNGAVGTAAAEKAAMRFDSEGREVFIARPMGGVSDFNDLVKGEVIRDDRKLGSVDRQRAEHARGGGGPLQTEPAVAADTPIARPRAVSG